jgi:Domain of Unknown Function (DUF1080)
MLQSYRTVFLSLGLAVSTSLSSVMVGQEESKSKSPEVKAESSAKVEPAKESKPAPKADAPTENKPATKVDDPFSKEAKKPESKEQSKATDTPSDTKANPTDKNSQKTDKKSDNNTPKKQSDKPEPPPGKVPLPKLGSNTNEFIPGMPWRVHDLRRPRPKAVQPGKIDSAPPADARILFGGKDLSEWYHPGMEDEIYEPQWKVHQNGYFEIEPRSGSILTIDSFGSCQLHIEWMVPEGTIGTSQGRGNSGIKFMERYEVQVLDSFNNKTYADGQAASIYGQYPPLVNASREQGQWQTYEIFFEAPKYEGVKLLKAPNMTVIHNGILVQLHRELTGPTGLRGNAKEEVPPVAPIMLQDHGNRIRFRNIWIREL